MNGMYGYRHFGKIQPGFLTASEVGNMLSNLASHSSGSNGIISKATPVIPFDITAATEVQALGFVYDDIIDTMAQMHGAGQDTKNASIIVDKLLKSSATGVKPPRYTPPMSAPPTIPALGRQKSETAELKATVASVIERNGFLSFSFSIIDDIHASFLPHMT
jgi:hypothetical protein